MRINEIAEQRKFVKELETVSAALAVWAQDKFTKDEWCVGDVKLAIREAAKICGKEI